MQDKLAVIKRVIEEHQTIRYHVKLAGDSIPDQEALLDLERARADWIPGRLESLSAKHAKLQQVISTLEEGLKTHFAFEGKVLPPLLGELIMRALIMEHKEINRGISDAKSTVIDTRLEGLNRDELLAKETDIQQMIGSVCDLVEEHATKEELILDMVRKALEA